MNKKREMLLEPYTEENVLEADQVLVVRILPHWEGDRPFEKPPEATIENLTIVTVRVVFDYHGAYRDQLFMEHFPIHDVYDLERAFWMYRTVAMMCFRLGFTVTQDIHPDLYSILDQKTRKIDGRLAPGLPRIIEVQDEIPSK